MTVLFPALCKAIADIALAWVIGGVLFLLLAGPSSDPFLAAWQRRVKVSFLWAASIHLFATAGLFIAQVVVATDMALPEIVASGQTLENFGFDTHYGRITLARLALSLVLLLPTAILIRGRSREQQRSASIVTAGTAALIALIGPLAGHAAGEDDSRWLVPTYQLHVLAVSAWLGALPAWIWLVASVAVTPTETRRVYVAATLRRFSQLAIGFVVVVVTSGLVLAFSSASSAGEWLGTTYGQLIITKLALLACILLVANRIRTRFLPVMETVGAKPAAFLAGAGWAATELFCGVLIVGCAAALSSVIPARHDQPIWWLPFRFSIEATWPAWPTPVIAAGAFSLALLSLFWGLLVCLRKPQKVKAVAASAAAVISVVGGLSQISVQAYPDTYRRPSVAYSTISITNGKRLFAQNCADCHGSGGLGDGPAASTLPKPPANLSEPHTALHTAGDMFWWLSHGIPKSGMPGFADVLDEQARWDVINFLRTFSEGFQARLLSPEIVPDHPWLGAPNFFLEDENGAERELKDFREQSNVLLVFPEKSDAMRVEQLRLEQNRFRKERLWAIIVSPDAKLAAGVPNVRRGAQEVRESYDLLSRSTTNRGDPKRLEMGRHSMEFLIDRFGYIRARWLREEDECGWENSDELISRVRVLNREPKILPPAAQHVH
ncbi:MULTISPECIES: c-type cytochrome [Bradyrhizobium]|uniref:C-type cytochrome n=1 Tax=Bradyrhizobium frederickii TaxID=2560054 RepID=A0A4Y9NL36_9BRAD|nr:MULTISPECIES: c-type cytochrome [Bradyrhizobium]RTE88243.1 hypothetical protein D6B98_36985 [Bradyrhizobium sp. LVM 105]TFV30277.1 c-type cytochrome [Bradyrhizobium frederickii]TFV68501.1 c-type cytochrome [Bradyrhizobium frederickii]